MVSICANPACSAPLLPLHDGKLYQFEVRAISVPCVDPATPVREVPSRKTAQFWLCGQCSDQIRLVLQANAVQVVSLESEEALAANESSKVNAPYDYSCEIGLAQLPGHHRFKSEKIADIPAFS